MVGYGLRKQQYRADQQKLEALPAASWSRDHLDYPTEMAMAVVQAALSGAQKPDLHDIRHADSAQKVELTSLDIVQIDLGVRRARIAEGIGASGDQPASSELLYHVVGRDRRDSGDVGRGYGPGAAGPAGRGGATSTRDHGYQYEQGEDVP